MSAMHVATSRTPLALSRPRVAGQAVLIAVIAGVTWLAMMGVVVSSYILGHPIDFQPKPYAAYGLTDVAPTSYGSIHIAQANLSTDAGITTVQLSVQMSNIRTTAVEAPQIEELRLVDSKGNQVSQPGALYWNGPAFLPGQASTTIDITLQAPADAGVLWLEYHNIRGQDPIRFALNAGAAR